MIQTLFVLPRPIVLLLFLYSTATASNPHLRWDVHVVSSNSSYQIDSYALHSIQPSTNYKFRVRIVNAQDNSVCSICAKEFSAIGGYPIIQFNSQQKTIVAASVNNTWCQDIREPVSEWLIPFRTSSSGHLLIDVTTNGFATPRLIDGGLDDGQFDFSVSPFQRMNERGEIQHLLGTKISVSNAVFKPNSPNQFKLDFIPEVSTESSAISNRLNSNFVLLSENDWGSFEILKLTFGMNELSDNVCDGTVGLNLHSYIAYQNTTLVHTDAGLFQAMETKTGAYEYVRVLKECINRVQYTTQADEYAPECLTTFAFGQGNEKIWKMTSESGIFQELLGVSQTTFAQFLNDSAIEIIGGDKSVIACEIDVFLVKTSNGKFSVVTFNETSKNWTQTFVFPDTIPIVSTTDPVLILNNDSAIIPPSYNVTSNRTLLLTGIRFGRESSNDLFLYGSALIYSPDGGNSMFILQSFPAPITVSSFSTSSNGASYALMTSDGQIHFADIALRKFVQLQPSTPLSLDTNSLVFFDKLNNLWKLNAFVNGSVVDIKRTKVDLDAYSTLWGTLNPRACPYDEVFFVGSTEPVYVRQRLKPSEATFPTSIFLDRGQSYTFEIQMTPNDNCELRDLKIHFQLIRETYVHLKIDRIEFIEQRKVIYEVEVRDAAALRNQSHPGEDLILTELRMTVHNGAGCDNSKSDGNSKYLSTRSLIIHTGCPPFQSAVYSSGVLKHHECENPDRDVACVFFDDDYKPNFVINDEVSSLSRNYTGPYILRVIGGGLSLDTIVDYQADEARLIDSSTWAALNDLEKYNGYSIYNMSFNDITWSCGVNSKCGSIIPNFPNGPKYYLKIEMSTDTVSSNISYCSLNTVYIIRLYGLPLDFTVSLIATVSTLFVTSIGVCGVAVVKGRKDVGTSDNSLWERKDSTVVDANEKDKATKEEGFRIGPANLGGEKGKEADSANLTGSKPILRSSAFDYRER